MTAFLRRLDESKSWQLEGHLKFTMTERILGLPHENPEPQPPPGAKNPDTRRHRAAQCPNLT
ncbi:hypothetical protein KB1_24790 [Cutibacterium modestum]|uniref:Uncharacterized protein n=1 Tax=Cutibacterium modestum TaxID=2559073 RepID=A0AAD1KSN8_9ACTN|nr:hypothetical protein KB1_24790 [Cutibacterium modestum]